jgi:hypothetical protein
VIWFLNRLRLKVICQSVLRSVLAGMWERISTLTEIWFRFLYRRRGKPTAILDLRAQIDVL